MPRRQLICSVAVLIVAFSCRSVDAPVRQSPQAAILSAARNPLNQLSTVFTLKTVGVDSVRLVYYSPDGNRGVTPFLRPGASTIQLASLGLTPNTAYTHYVEFLGASTHDSIGPFVVNSGPVPAALSNLKLSITGRPTGGYLLTSITMTPDTTALIALDSLGNVRWYRLFGTPGGGEDAEQQRNGDFTVFLGTTRGFDDTRGYYAEVRPTGEMVRSFVAPDSLYTDGHELLLTFRDTTLLAAHFSGYERRIMTLQRSTGPIDTVLAVHTIVRLRPDGTLAWRFRADSILSPSDWIEPPPTLGDIDHPNSLTFDQPGNYVISFRNAGEITSIDSATGNVLWRLGGTHNQFTFVNDPLGGFSAQHYVRVLPNGHLLLFDNGWRHVPQQSRAVEYALDIPNRMATMVWEYRHSPSIFAQFVGSAQRLSSGNTLVGWGFVGVVTEVDPTGNVVWEGTFTNGATQTFYRMLKVPSLYQYQTP